MFPCRFLPILLLSTIAVACSDSSEPTAEAAGAQASESSDPPGVAQALSLAGKFDDQDMSAYDRAIACAAALRITARALAPMTSGENSREVRLINTASDQFASRARNLDEGTGQDVAVDIAARAEEKAADRTGQAQLAITCANSLD